MFNLSTKNISMLDKVFWTFQHISKLKAFNITLRNQLFIVDNEIIYEQKIEELRIFLSSEYNTLDQLDQEGKCHKDELALVRKHGPDSFSPPSNPAYL